MITLTADWVIVSEDRSGHFDWGYYRIVGNHASTLLGHRQWTKHHGEWKCHDDPTLLAYGIFPAARFEQRWPKIQRDAKKAREARKARS